MPCRSLPSLRTLVAFALCACGARSSLDNRRLEGFEAPTEPDAVGSSNGRGPAAAVGPPLASSAFEVDPRTTTPTTDQPTVAHEVTDAGWASCRKPLSLDFGASASGTYTSFSDDALDTVRTPCGSGKDVVFSWRAPRGGYVAFSTPDTEYAVGVALLPDGSECSSVLACSPGGSGLTRLEHFVQLGETYRIALESTDTGRFSLNVEYVDAQRLLTSLARRRITR